MIFAFLTLLAALSLAAVADWFSIIGFMAIYAAAPIPILVMGIVLALAKLVTTSWVYRNWQYSEWKLKVPLIYFVLALMVATSIGTFGFLSKAHLEQGAGTIDNSAKIERLDQQIAREKATIADNEKVTAQLDATINSYIGKDKTDKSLAVRKSQAPQRKQLRDDVGVAQKRIDGYSDERLKLQSEVRKQQLDVGPIRYIAELFYGVTEDATKNIESAVRLFTLLIVSTLDPLAVILLVAANHTLLRLRDEKDKKTSKTTVQNHDGYDARDLAAPSDNKETCQTTQAQDYEEGAVPVWKVPEQTTKLSDLEGVTTEGEIPLPILPKTLEFLDENSNTNVEETEAVVTTAENTQCSDTETSASMPFISSEERISTSRTNKEIQKVNHEEKDTILEASRHTSITESRSPVSPVIRSPRLTRVSARDFSEKTTVDDKIQGLPSLTHRVTPHFIPQRLNEEECIETEEEFGRAAAPDDKRNTKTVSFEGQSSSQEKDEVSESLSESVSTVSTNKYPIALSWLSEFKRVGYG